MTFAKLLVSIMDNIVIQCATKILFAQCSETRMNIQIKSETIVSLFDGIFISWLGGVTYIQVVGIFTGQHNHTLRY
jgi:hypothetical protein